MVDADESQPMRELSPGKILLQGRLQAGLTQEQVAKELYMTVNKVSALEADDYSRLSSDTFARGYIRAYANLVKVDVVVALSAYDQLIEQIKPDTTAQQQVAPAAENSHRGTWQFLIVIGAFLVGLWLISVWFFDNHSESEYLVSTENLSSSVSQEVTKSFAVSSVAVNELSSAAASTSFSSEFSAGGVKPANIINGSSSVSSLYATSSQAGVGALPAVSGSSTAAQTSTSSSVKKASLDEISFSFRAECWLEVSDSRGDVLATELEPAGGKVKLLGVAPFDVKLGNAPAVDIELNGKKVDVVPLIGTNVLILKVGN